MFCCSRSCSISPAARIIPSPPSTSSSRDGRHRLAAGWTWVVVASVAACYGMLLARHLRFSRDCPINSRARELAALVLVCADCNLHRRVIRSLRQREFELTAFRDRAARSEQLAALTTLAAGAAHELNTPLGTIAVIAKELELSRDATGNGDVVTEDARLIRGRSNAVERFSVGCGWTSAKIFPIAPSCLSTHGVQSPRQHREENLPRLKISRESDIQQFKCRRGRLSRHCWCFCAMPWTHLHQ